MVVKMMRWRPWPPIASKKYEVKLVVTRVDGLYLDAAEQGDVAAGKEEIAAVAAARLMAEIRWKGPKIALGTFRRTVKRNFTKEESLQSNGVVEWREEFHNVCSFSLYKENGFHPWEIAFTIFKGLNQGLKNKVPAIGTASLNLAEFVSAAEEKELEIVLPLSLVSGASEPPPSLHLAISCLELRTVQESSETVQRSIVPIPLSPRSGEPQATEKDELSALKAGLRKVKILTEYVSTRRSKKACFEEEGSDGRYSGRSEDGEYTYPFDTDSLEELDERELEDAKENSSFRKSFNYGTLASANCVGGSYYLGMPINGENEDLIYYSNRKPDVGSANVEETSFSVLEQSKMQISKRSILSWRKRKLSFRSPKAKGEPLLKKAYGEEGGDDIDFDRRQLSSSDESFGVGQWRKSDGETTANRPSVSEFGDDNFAVGCWEQKEVISRDGHMKLSTQVFFASIDQRSERAAGESACTALVAVIADWFQTNRDMLPIKSQFDSLIREGSLEWRNLCENEAYRERFPDKHFDLETVLQAKIRPLSVVPDKSFIGFFHPDNVAEGGFDFLHGAMSFDNIWDEISRAGSCSSNSNPQIYIVSWNDHFFVLKVEPEAFYIIDTLGERLYEGCNQAYILKFDKETTIYRLPAEIANANEEKPEKATSESEKQQALQVCPTETAGCISEETGNREEEELEVVSKGKDACKEYIKNFLAAIPIGELLNDVKKGLMASTPLHHRLQIECHLTEFSQPMVASPPPEATGSAITLSTITVI